MNLLESKVAPRAKGYGSVQHLSDVISTNKSVGDIYYMGLALKKLHNRRLPKVLETKLLQNPRLALDYCRRVLKRRWPELEIIIMMGSNIILQLKYYVRIAKGVRASKQVEDNWAHNFRALYNNNYWGEFERGGRYSSTKIPNDGMLFIQYARNNIKGRWFTLEPYIIQLFGIHDTVGSNYWKEYIKQIIKGQWPELEEYIFQVYGSRGFTNHYIPFLQSIGIEYQYDNPKYAIEIANNIF